MLAKEKTNQLFLPLEKEESEQYPASHFKRAAILPIQQKRREISNLFNKFSTHFQNDFTNDDA